MREDAREVNKLFEHIEQRAPFRAATARDDLPPGLAEFHEMLGDDDGFDEKHVVLFDEHGDLVANRAERGELDLDELAAADDVDTVAADALFDEAAVGGVKFFELAV